MSFRIGHGFDVHQLQEGFKLIIGGIQVDSAKGSVGHSDGDVLIHSIVDAILGALAMGDLGTFFPSSDNKWKGCDSSVFLLEALSMIKNNNFIIQNIDSTIILQSPAINSYIGNIRKNLAELMNIKINQISVKATTTDRLGLIGRGEGIGAFASLSLIKL